MIYLAMILQEDLCAYCLLCQRGDNGGGDIIFSICAAHTFITITLRVPLKI